MWAGHRWPYIRGVLIRGHVDLSGLSLPDVINVLFSLFIDQFQDAPRERVITELSTLLDKSPVAERETWGTQVNDTQRVKLAEYGPGTVAPPKRKQVTT